MLCRIIIFFLSFSCLCGCLSDPSNKKSTVDHSGIVGNFEATGFTIQQNNLWQRLTVANPWQKSTDNIFEYYLLNSGVNIPDELKNRQVIFTPVKRVICLSTTHIGFLDALDEVGSIIGLSGINYLTNPEVKKGVSGNRIQEVGYEQGLNYEMILQLKPDVVFAYGVGAEINTQVNKLHDLGIPVVLVGEYLEQSPLAKAEWLKFFGAFFGKEAEAGSIFEKIKSNYQGIKSITAKVQERPTVLTGLPFKDTWWIAGGQSNLAVLIEDAGGKFLWRENRSKEAFPVSLEEVFLRAANADFWINCGSVNSQSELLAFDSRYSDLPAVKNQRIYNNNLRTVPGGGNDYWESGVVHPDLVLADLVKILHPEISGIGDFYYYKRIQ
ncbi:MAG: ABC transporter substrate-binding protein [Prolixibacteraceae bacterium]|jgi:iron complex transport system substrate-binding protein|nr:ABC transporter substrate-binding protein [Prolixibacteraceae bacterium]